MSESQLRDNFGSADFQSLSAPVISNAVHMKVGRELGAEHNRLLLAQLPNRTVWSVEADRLAQLVPYSEDIARAPAHLEMQTDSNGVQARHKSGE